jgi:hypothetical protein
LVHVRTSGRHCLLIGELKIAKAHVVQGSGSVHPLLELPGLEVHRVIASHTLGIHRIHCGALGVLRRSGGRLGVELVSDGILRSVAALDLLGHALLTSQCLVVLAAILGVCVLLPTDAIEHRLLVPLVGSIGLPHVVTLLLTDPGLVVEKGLMLASQFVLDGSIARVGARSTYITADAANNSANAGTNCGADDRNDTTRYGPSGCASG